MFSLVSHLIKRDTNVSIQPQRNFKSMDVKFAENQPFFPKNSLQGENIVEKENFWETLQIPEVSIPLINPN